MIRRPPSSTLFPYTTLFRSEFMSMEHARVAMGRILPKVGDTLVTNRRRPILTLIEDTSGGVHDTLLAACDRRSEEHTSELQSRVDLVCRLLLEKKKKIRNKN